MSARECPEPNESEPVPPMTSGNRSFLLTLVALLVFVLTACGAVYGVAALMRPEPVKKG